MKRHGLDVISAGFGLLFVWVGLVELIPGMSVRVAVVWPILAVAGGIALLISALRRDREDESV